MFKPLSPCNSTTSLPYALSLLVCSLSSLLACSAMMRRPVRALHASLTSSVHELCNSARICARDAAPAYSLLATLLACLLAPTRSLRARSQLCSLVLLRRSVRARSMQLCSHLYILTLCTVYPRSVHLCAHLRWFMFSNGNTTCDRGN
jgi:hypothetical protein